MRIVCADGSNRVASSGVSPARTRPNNSVLNATGYGGLDVGTSSLLLATNPSLSVSGEPRYPQALALRWCDIDMELDRLHVRHSLQRQDGALVFVAPKTRRSVRTVPLPEVCLSALRSHRERQAEEREAMEPYWQDFDLVFTTSYGTAIDPRNVNRWFDELCDRAGVRRLRVYDLRHTCASLLLAQGVSARAVMEVLGHSQTAVTLDLYTHVLPAVQEMAAAEMDRALGPVGVPMGVPGSDSPGTEAPGST